MRLKLLNHQSIPVYAGLLHLSVSTCAITGHFNKLYFIVDGRFLF